MAAAKPSAKADMDPKFEKRLRQLKDDAKEEYNKRKVGEQVKWFRPPEWEGDLFDFEGMSEPFNREKANDDYVKAVENAEAPGTTGDIIVTTTMIDELAMMEAAFRSRHTMRRPRAVAHMLARKRGQGDDKGPFIQLGIEYVRGLLEQSRT